MTVMGSSPAETHRPLRADAARNRARLLEAARELFARRGLAVTMDEIARHAGVGVGTAYRRFASREAVIDALFEDRMEQVVANVEAALADPDPWHGLAAMVERSIEMQAADRGLKELLFSPPELRERVAGMRERMMPLVDQVFTRAREAGVLRADVTPLDLPAVNYMLGAAVDLGGEVEPELWRRYVGILLDGLRARRDAPTPLAHGPLEPSQLDEAISNCHGRR